jgi:hypothetical protein
MTRPTVLIVPTGHPTHRWHWQVQHRGLMWAHGHTVTRTCARIQVWRTIRQARHKGARI